jgi:hypothetical protein
VYHSSNVFGGCSDRIIGLCRPQGSVSRYRSVNARESFIPICDTRRRNLELCSIIEPSPRRSFFKGLAWFIVWLERFLDGFHKFLVCPPIWLVRFCLLAFFNFRLDKLLFPDSSISSSQVRQDEEDLLVVVIVCRLIDFQVNIYILHEQDEIGSFPSEGCRWVEFDILKSLCRHGCRFFGHGIGIGFVICRGFKVSVLVSFLGVEVSGVSSIVESRFRGISLSECQGVGVRCKDTGTFVGESTLLLDFETFRQNV